MNAQISFALVRLKYRARPAIRVPSRAISLTLRSEAKDKKVHLISSPLQVPSQIQVPAPGQCRLKTKIRMLFGQCFDFSQHRASRLDRCALWRLRLKPVRDNIGIYKIRTVRIVCQELPRERCLARSIRPRKFVVLTICHQMAQHLYPLQQINRHTREQQQTFTFALLNFYTLPRGTSDV